MLEKKGEDGSEGVKRDEFKTGTSAGTSFSSSVALLGF